MAERLYADFIGLNTFIYEPLGWDVDEQAKTLSLFARSAIAAAGITNNKVIRLTCHK